VLPTRPNNGADTTRGQLGCLTEADADRGRLVPVTVHCLDQGVIEPLYVHAKVGIVDDHWLTIGSANLNEHSLFNDTELNLVSLDPALARSTRLQLWSEHLEMPIEDVDGEPADVIDRLWKPIANAQLDRRQDGQILTHHLMRLPAVSRRTRRLLGPIRGLVVDG
jgi:phosphatidylserine/phosphatidylglycerophosphate/cardiolipin synthase-like enzyme